MTRVAVVGSHKDWTVASEAHAKRAIRYHLYPFQIGGTIVSGGAKGADTWGERIGVDEYHMTPDIYLPDFARYGVPAAYFVRNKLIAENCDILFAFFPDERVTQGTKSTMGHALKLGIPVWEWHYGMELDVRRTSSL